MMNIIQNVINMYKSDPIKFFMMIAIIYLILRSFNVIESFRPSNVATDIDLQALSTASQLAQTWQKAFDIDATGNVTFKKNVTNNGTLLNKGVVTINSTLNQSIGGHTKAQLHDGRVLGTHAIFGPVTGSSQDTKVTINSNGNIESKGNITSNGKKVVVHDKLLHIKTDNNMFVQRGSGNRMYFYPITHNIADLKIVEK